jgi:hypothetical protein
VSSGKDATGADRHIAGVIKRQAGVGVIYDELVGRAAMVRELRKVMQPELDKVISALFDQHKVSDAGLRCELKDYAEMSAEDAIKEKLGGMRDDVLKKLIADERVHTALEQACKAAWSAACKKWVESVIEQAWDPRVDLIKWAKMAVYPKHLLATTEPDAVKLSKTNAQYWPKDGCEELVRTTLLNGQWVRGGSTVHAYFDFAPRVVGFDGGAPSTRHRGELTQGSPAEMHGHPRLNG